MKRILTLSLIIIFINQALSQDIKEYYFKFKIKDQSELDKITRIISIDNVKDNKVYAYALQHELDQFLEMGYKVEYIEKQIPKSITMATTVADMSNWDKYPTYEVYRQMMKNFQSDFPDICKLDSIGTTNDGRQLYVLKISDNVHNNEAEPEFFYTSTMHGDETTGFILLLRLADSLLTTYNSANEIKNLVDHMEIYINPNANPDGTYAGGNSTVASATRTNGYADINRDFPDPNIGANSPYQPETQAMMDYAEERNFSISANFHGGAEVMNYPWDTWYISENRHADTEWFEKICTDYVASARTVSSSYMTDVTADGVTHGASWYKVNGSRQDYMNYWHQCREITIELSSTKLLASENLNKYWDYNKQALINLIEESLYGLKGTVKNDEGNPVHAMIWINDHDEENDSSMVFSNPDFGDYYRPIESGNYNITASAQGYLPTTIENINIAYQDSQVVNFVLQKADTCTLTGIITDASNGNPIENANVKLSNSSEYSGLTNSNGEYFIEIPEGNYQVVIEKKGYTLHKSDIELRLSDTIYHFNLYQAETEDFESNTFDQFNWQHSGSSQWVITNTDAYEGNFAAKSGVISHGQTSTLSLDVNIENSGILSFYKKVSSESAYDFLKFYIDDVEQQKWSGEINWSIADFEIDSGMHNLKWVYTKDQAVSTGNDCAWIDMISFPQFVSEINSINKADIHALSNIAIYPNPFNSYFELDFYTQQKSVLVELYDICGISLYKKRYHTVPNQKHHLIIYESDLQRNPLQIGVYFIQLKSSDGIVTRRLLKD